MATHQNLLPDIDPQETREWMDSLASVIEMHGIRRAEYLLRHLLHRARDYDVSLPGLIWTPYINTIDPSDEPPYPGDEQMELRIRRIIRWNAVAMVMRANKRSPGLGGHLASYASSASLYEVGFHHFFRGKDNGLPGDSIYFQGHAAPGIYARAYLEGRIDENRLSNFRRELPLGNGLSSYPHPRLMKDFWEFPTVSMGLGPIAAIYQARFHRYLAARGIADTDSANIWCFIGDGETDEVECRGAVHLAARENLDNLIFVVNCNLQRLDGPVRGNAKIVQELEGFFRGMGWNVIKVLWGRGWDELLRKDIHGLLVDTLNRMTDGEAQKYSIESSSEFRKSFFGRDPRLLKMVEDIDDKDLRKGLRRGGHDYTKIYAAYARAVKRNGKPTVVLAQTVKGWVLGEEMMAKNITHQRKKMSLKELKIFRDLLDLPIPDSQLTDEPPFYHPGPNSDEVRYIQERRQALGGFVPVRNRTCDTPRLPQSCYEEFFRGIPEGQAVSTTMAFTRLLTLLMREEPFGKRIVPIVPDEARTFGMNTMFPEFGIYSPVGQLYTPVDKDKMLYYREEKDGQVLEEGISEAGAMASFLAAGSSHSINGKAMIPFYIFYSMFGLQRTGDQVYQSGDMRCRGFLIGGTAGRTTLNGEGLQHQDGHSLVLAEAFPHVVSYDPAFAFELALIIRHGLHRMIEQHEDIVYYITVYNENYWMPPMPDHIRDHQDDIIQGLYVYRPSQLEPSKERKSPPKVQLLGSGPILQQAMKAADILENEFGVAADVWSVTSYTELRREALAVDRWNFLHPDQPARIPFITKKLGATHGPIIAVSDYMKSLPDSVSRWLDGRLVSLGTDGFGLSEDRAILRRHFEIDSESIVLRALYQLSLQKSIEISVVKAARKKFGFDPEKGNPMEIP